MSADNWLGIVEKKGKFKGYMYKASDNERISRRPIFETDNVVDAITEAQDYCYHNIVEYGYFFLNTFKNIRKGGGMGRRDGSGKGRRANRNRGGCKRGGPGFGRGGGRGKGRGRKR